MSGSTKAIKVGILGLGNIGAGTIEILQRNGGLIERRLGVPFEVTRVADLDPARAERLGLSRDVFTTDAMAVVTDPAVQVVVELIGGIEPARSLILAAMDHGQARRHRQQGVARHALGRARHAARSRSGSASGSRGAWRGASRSSTRIRRGLVANRIRRVTGILNGTCNYILTRMEKEQKPFGEILADAQANGFAEANPALDVDGIDASHKLAILANLCFDLAVGPDAITCCGIRAVTPLDLATARELGYRMKLLCSATNVEGKVEAWVHPALIPALAPARRRRRRLQRGLPGGRQPRSVALLGPRCRRAPHGQRRDRRPRLVGARHPLRRRLSHARQRRADPQPGARSAARTRARRGATSTCGSLRSISPACCRPSRASSAGTASPSPR